MTKSTHTKIQEVSTSSSDYNDYSKFETTPRNLSYDEAKAQTDKAKVNSDVEDIQKQIKELEDKQKAATASAKAAENQVKQALDN